MKLITEKSTELVKFILCCISDVRGYCILQSFSWERTRLCFNLTLWCWFKVIMMFLTPCGSHGSQNAHFIQELLCRRLCEETGALWNPVMWDGWTWAQIFQSWSEAIAHVQTAWFCSTSGAWEEPDLKMGAWKDLISCPSQELLLHMVMSSALSLPPCSNPQEWICL